MEKRYKVIAACCFLTGLNIMLDHGDITPAELHEDDAKPLVREGFLAELDEWDVPATDTPANTDPTKDETKTVTNTGRGKR